MDKAALARAKNLPISWKVSYEIGNAIRGKPVVKVEAFLERVISGSEAVPYKRFNSDVGHKPGKMAAGRYPIKAAEYILSLVRSAKSNAEDKGLNVDALELVHFSSNRGVSQWRHGRQRRRKMKSTNLDIVVSENSSLVKVAKPKKESAVAKPKAESKVETTKPAPKKVDSVKVKESGSDSSVKKEIKVESKNSEADKK